MMTLLSVGISILISASAFAVTVPEKNKVTDRYWCQDEQCLLRQKARERSRSRSERLQQKQKKKETAKPAEKT